MHEGMGKISVFLLRGHRETQMAEVTSPALHGASQSRGQHGHALARSPRGHLEAQGGRDGRAGDRGPFPHCWVAQRGLPKVQLKYWCDTGWACRGALGPLCNVNICAFPAPLFIAYQF